MQRRDQDATLVVKASQGRFLTLDAMRGIAAVVVCISHFQEHVGGWYPRFAYLAVDLFFILSGFVISRAYDTRLSTTMSFSRFFLLRFCRLFPMLAVGAILGFFSFGTEVFATRLLDTLLNGAAIPAIPLHHELYLTPGNRALWSLIYELWVANLVYGLFHRFLQRPLALAVVVLLGATGMIWTMHSAGWLNVGWGWGAHQVAFGLSRVTWGFFAGVALERLHRRFKPPHVPPVIILLITGACLCAPLRGGHVVRLIELALPLLVFPPLVWLGATAREHKSGLGFKLGEASYALYAVHFPLIVMLAPFLIGSSFSSLPFTTQALGEFAIITMIVLSSWLLAKSVDDPAQRLLKSWAYHTTSKR